MTEFWESSFREHKDMWGQHPANVTFDALELFLSIEAHNILVPGFGYGRNANVFTDAGMKVTGIEISKTAIALAKKQYGEDIRVYHGSVSDMPFDADLYEGIYSYALMHLLGKNERLKFIKDGYDQLAPGGYMVNVSLSTSDSRYGKGTLLEPDQFQSKHGVNLFFYNHQSIEKEFGDFGLQEFMEIQEPKNANPGKPVQNFWKIICRKPAEN